MRFRSHNIMTIDTNKTKICISTGQSFVRHVRKEYALTETETRSIQIELKKRLIMSIIHQKMKNRWKSPYKKNENKQELTNIWTIRIGNITKKNKFKKPKTKWKIYRHKEDQYTQAADHITQVRETPSVSPDTLKIAIIKHKSYVLPIKKKHKELGNLNCIKEIDKNKVIRTRQNVQSLLSACWYDLTQKSGSFNFECIFIIDWIRLSDFYFNK